MENEGNEGRNARKASEWVSEWEREDEVGRVFKASLTLPPRSHGTTNGRETNAAVKFF